MANVADALQQTVENYNLPINVDEIASISDETSDYDDPVGAKKQKLSNWIKENNIIDEIVNKGDLIRRIQDEYSVADQSMTKWKRKYDLALKLARLEPEEAAKTFPFEGASTVMLPIVLDAMLDFHGRTIPDLVYAENLLSISIKGATNKDKEERQEAVQMFMQDQLLYQIPKWQRTQDKLLLVLPNVGTVFKKIYRDFAKNKMRSEMVMPDKVKFNHAVDDFSEAKDVFMDFTLSRNEVITKIRGKEQWKIEEDSLPVDVQEYNFIECRTWHDNDEDGLMEPYIAIYFEKTMDVVCVYTNYEEDDIYENDEKQIVEVCPSVCYVQYIFIPDPDGGCMGWGWGMLLSATLESINTTMQQLLDGGTLSITAANSGFIVQDMQYGRGNLTQTGPIELELGKFKPVMTRSGTSISDNFYQLPFAGINPVYFELMKYQVDLAREMTNAAVTVETHAGEAASLYLARLQQGLKRPNSIITRVYNCQSQEYALLYKLNYQYYDDDLYNNIIDLPVKRSMLSDFNLKDADVAPMADPIQGSDIERVGKAQAVLQEAKEQPSQEINYRQALIDYFKSLKVRDLDLLMPEKDPNYKDPMQTLLLQQKMFEAETTNRELRIREMRAALDEFQLAMDYEEKIKQADKVDSEIAKNYATALKTLQEAGLVNIQTAMARLQALTPNVEGDATNESRKTQVPTTYALPSREVAARPGDPNISELPPMAQM